MLSMEIGQSREIVVDPCRNTWKFGEWEGDERNPATVTCLGPDHYRLVCGCYYGEHGVFEMTITQPLGRAVRTFVAALRADNELEDEACRANQRAS